MEIRKCQLCFILTFHPQAMCLSAAHQTGICRGNAHLAPSQQQQEKHVVVLVCDTAAI